MQCAYVLKSFTLGTREREAVPSTSISALDESLAELLVLLEGVTSRPRDRRMLICISSGDEWWDRAHGRDKTRE